MILKFGTSDLLNTTLVDVKTGNLTYNIATQLLSTHEEKSPSDPPIRTTWVYDSTGCVVGKIGWQGQHPQDIAIGDETIGDLARLFGSSSVRFQPKILSIPTRFDAELIWTATAYSLTLVDYETEATKGEFHHNSIRIGDRFLKTHVPGLGGEYLEFHCHPSAHPAEFVVSFIMIEILRRARFNLTRFAFEQPKLETSRETHNSILQKVKYCTDGIFSVL